MSIINGKEISNHILGRIKNNIEKNQIKAILVVIQIGNNKESSIYIEKKRDACNKVGITSKIYNLDIDIENNELYKLIDRLNQDETINGILVQLPIPEHLDQNKILKRINPVKDVDGFHPENMGNLAMNNRTPLFIPCTPKGCLELLKRENVNLEGKHVVIIGKSNIVGLPMALLLMKHNATVTVCDDKTENIKQHTCSADILISACGQAEMIKSDWIKDDVIIIDVGINPIKDDTKKNGYRLVGDVDFNSVKNKASKITPVPGGVGPITVSMLLSNTLDAYLLQNPII